MTCRCPAQSESFGTSFNQRYHNTTGSKKGSTAKNRRRRSYLRGIAAITPAINVTYSNITPTFFTKRKTTKSNSLDASKCTRRYALQCKKSKQAKKKKKKKKKNTPLSRSPLSHQRRPRTRRLKFPHRPFLPSSFLPLLLLILTHTNRARSGSTTTPLILPLSDTAILPLSNPFPALILPPSNHFRHSSSIHTPPRADIPREPARNAVSSRSSIRRFRSGLCRRPLSIRLPSRQ
jgi:hypothetical protein